MNPMILLGLLDLDDDPILVVVLLNQVDIVLDLLFGKIALLLGQWLLELVGGCLLVLGGVLLDDLLERLGEVLVVEVLALVEEVVADLVDLELALLLLGLEDVAGLLLEEVLLLLEAGAVVGRLERERQRRDLACEGDLLL